MVSGLISVFSRFELLYRNLDSVVFTNVEWANIDFNKSKDIIDEENGEENLSIEYNLFTEEAVLCTAN